MIQRLKPWYPFFFALLPIMNILARNPGGSRLTDIAVVLASALILCAVVYLLLAALLRRTKLRAVVPFAVLTLVLWFYSKIPLGVAAREAGGGASGAALLLLLAVVTVAVWWWLGRRPHYLDRVNIFFTLTGALLLGWLTVQFAVGLFRARSVVQGSKLAEQLARPVPTKPDTPGAPQRDIYLIVMDEYANSAVLRERFQFDNRAFEDSLRQLGFTVPMLVRSNYVHTLLSLPSLLNFSHLTALTNEVGARGSDGTLPNYLLENNRTVAFLKQRGYRFLFFPSKWWPSTDHNRNADWEFDAWKDFNLGRAATNSDLRRALVRRTALRLLVKEDAWDGEHVKRTLAALQDVPRQPEPTFVFAHLISPHSPYVLDSNCRIGKAGSVRDPIKNQLAYVDQLKCLDSLVLQTVTTILHRSSVPPVILLQGDHGSNMLRYSDEKTVQAVSPAQARERFGAFGAYYVPEGGGRLFADTVTIVNVFQKVLTHYFGADLAPAPDSLYMSLERTPYDFRKMDPASLMITAGQVPVAPRAARVTSP